MLYAKIDFLIVIISITTLTIMLVDDAVLNQTHFHHEYLGNYTVPSLRGGGGGGREAVPPERLLGLLKMLFLEHYSTTRLQAMMEKGIVAFKHNSPLTFSRFFAKLLATNYCVT